MKTIFTLYSCCVLLLANAQTPYTIMSSADSVPRWNLQKCIDYAMANNIPVRQSDVAARLASRDYQQAKMNRLPNVGIRSSLGVLGGTTIDPSSNNYSFDNALFNSFGANANVEVFSWGKLKNLQNAARFDAEAALAQMEGTQRTVAVTITSYYLQVLAAKEQVLINQSQVDLTANQVGITEKQVKAGIIPELNLAEIRAQLSNDSSNLIAAQNLHEQTLWAIKGLLNINAASNFQIEEMPYERILMQGLLELQPDAVYQVALNVQPQQRADRLYVKAAEKYMDAAKSTMYPTVSFGVSLTTVFYKTFNKVSGYTINDYTPLEGLEPMVNVGGTNYYVQSPQYTVTKTRRNVSELFDGYGRQLKNNFGQTYAMTLSVPIFNNGRNRNEYNKSKLNYRNVELQRQLNNQGLETNIYSAYINARSSMQRVVAETKNVESAKKAYEFSSKRYTVGLMSSIDLLVNQNNYLRARLQLATSQYDYVFRVKLLEYYKGMALAL
jgi:outer membrane protein